LVVEVRQGRLGHVPLPEQRNLLVFRLAAAGQAAYLKVTAGVNPAATGTEGGSGW
jgi:hypothetical protein